MHTADTIQTLWYKKHTALIMVILIIWYYSNKRKLVFLKMFLIFHLPSLTQGGQNWKNTTWCNTIQQHHKLIQNNLTLKSTPPQSKSNKNWTLKLSLRQQLCRTVWMFYISSSAVNPTHIVYLGGLPKEGVYSAVCFPLCQQCYLLSLSAISFTKLLKKHFWHLGCFQEWLWCHNSRWGACEGGLLLIFFFNKDMSYIDVRLCS